MGKRKEKGCHGHDTLLKNSKQTKYNPKTCEKQKKKTCYTVCKDGREYTLCLVGRYAQTLSALIDVGNKGVTALEVSSWALRLASYVYILRHKHGLNIETKTEPHNGGDHARYFLHSDVSFPKP